MSGQELTTAQAVHEWASDNKLQCPWVRGRRRAPAAAVGEQAHDRSLPLSDRLAGTAASAQPETP